MTLQEFKAWFEGFAEGMHGEPPTAKQWARIKARVAEIDGKQITERVFIDRYLPGYYPYSPTPYHPWPWWSTTTSIPLSTNLNVLDDGHHVFSSTTAMLALGQAEAANLVANAT